MTVRILPLGERALQVQCGAEKSPAWWAELARTIRDRGAHVGLAGIEEVVPAERSLLLVFGADFLPGARQRRALRALLPIIAGNAERAASTHRLPVCYTSEFAPDLPAIAKAAGLSATDVIGLHTGIGYTVQAVGFAPGFAYMGAVDARIATSRLATPRTRVPAGAVGIADARTAVYPAASPGGWNIIGRCPLRLFDATRLPPGRLQVGDRVEFYAVTAAEFADLEARR